MPALHSRRLLRREQARARSPRTRVLLAKLARGLATDWPCSFIRVHPQSTAVPCMRMTTGDLMMQHAMQHARSFCGCHAAVLIALGAVPALSATHAPSTLLAATRPAVMS
jgi:hypothetical protein